MRRTFSVLRPSLAVSTCNRMGDEVWCHSRRKRRKDAARSSAQRCFRNVSFLEIALELQEVRKIPSSRGPTQYHVSVIVSLSHFSVPRTYCPCPAIDPCVAWGRAHFLHTSAGSYPHVRFAARASLRQPQPQRRRAISKLTNGCGRLSSSCYHQSHLHVRALNFTPFTCCLRLQSASHRS